LTLQLDSELCSRLLGGLMTPCMVRRSTSRGQQTSSAEICALQWVTHILQMSSFFDFT